MQTELEQITKLVHNLSLEDLNKLRKIIDKEHSNKSGKIDANIKPKRVLEVLRDFHDDFYNEEKDSFSQQELRDALNWILAKYEESES